MEIILLIIFIDIFSFSKYIKTIIPLSIGKNNLEWLIHAYNLSIYDSLDVGPLLLNLKEDILFC